MPRVLRLADDIDVELVRKDIRTLRLSVHPPEGRVRLAAPVALSQEAIDAFLCARLGWIRKHRTDLASRPRIPPGRYLDGEWHWFGGNRYRLQIIASAGPGRVELADDRLTLRVRPSCTAGQRRALLEDWYRARLKATVPGLIATYQPRMGVQVREFGVKRMKTRWGSCNPRARRIWLNLALAQASFACLEYVVVHEMAHLLERRHNARFYALMERFLPGWHACREELNGWQPGP